MFREVRVCFLVTIFAFFKLSSEKEIYYQDVNEILQIWTKELTEQLQSLSDAVTRREEVVKSFEDIKLHQEKGGSILNSIVNNLQRMMQNNVRAVENIAKLTEELNLNRKNLILENSTYNYINTDEIYNNISMDENYLKKLESYQAESEQFMECEKLEANYKNKISKQSETSTGLERKYKKCQNVPYIEKEGIYFNNIPLYYDRQFGTEVNTNYSAVRVSPNVYKREEEMLNEIRLTDPLDLIFKENLKKDPNIGWQYFASPKGFMRFYPAMKWSAEKYNQTFDFRIRSWFVEAMTSPKDVIILLDRSGSMKGKRRVLSRYIINNILDTLYDNDYVNVYTVSNDTQPLVECFDYNLVQAHEENLRLLRESLNGYHDRFVSDVTLGFKKAFEVLKIYRERHRGGAQCNQAIMLITEGLDYDYNPELFKIYNTKEDDKFYRHVRIFTYQLQTDPNDAKIMEWIACANMGYYANISEASEAHERTLKYLNVMSRPINLHFKDLPNSKHVAPIWSALYVHLADRRLSNWLWNKFEGNRQRDKFLEFARLKAKMNGLKHDDDYPYLLTTDHEYLKYRRTFNYNYMITVSMPIIDRRSHAIDVLGVAAVDISRDFIKYLIDYYLLGVNGYAFLVTNNGYVILHPDHRTEFENILKPTFNRVDLLEVEILDDNMEPRRFHPSIIEMRRNIIEQRNGSKTLTVKAHIDHMKRVVLTRRHYFYTGLEKFSFGIVLPDYGLNKFTHNDLENIYNDTLKNIHHSNFWKIHPEWHYCKLYGNLYNFNTPEEELLYFIKNAKGNELPQKNCDVRLVKSLLADINRTEWFDQQLNNNVNLELKQLLNKYYVKNAFMVTQTGLTRWQDIIKQPVNDDHFSNRHNKAFDEVWFQRAAEINFRDTKMYVYSVPFYSEEYYFEKVVTVSNVIFKYPPKTPIAGVGYQFYLENLHSLFMSITQNVSLCGKEKCKLTCNGEELDCYVIDNNGYIIVGDNSRDSGKFIGDLKPLAFDDMVSDGVFKKTRFFDYQAICYYPPVTKSPGSIHYFNIFKQILDFLSWIVVTLFYLVEAVLAGPDYQTRKKEMLEFERLEIPKTVPTPCDKELWLYTFGKEYNNNKVRSRKNWSYITKKINGSNLLFLVVNGLVEYNSSTNGINQKEISYNVSLPCYIATKNNYTRRSYIKCFNRDTKEDGLNANKTYCGSQGYINFDI